MAAPDGKTEGSRQSAGINPGYADFQLAKAFTAIEEGSDPAAVERARAKLAKWEGVLDSILRGTIHHGTRTPVAETPSWATLEVVTGGFATGGLLAGGPLQAHEQELLKSLPNRREGDERWSLNSYFLTDAGLSKLLDWLKTGCFEVTVPEEGALLTAAWLVENGYADQARALLEHISPFFEKLRFYPVARERPLPRGAYLHLQTVGNTIRDLQNVKPNHNILAQKEAVEVWAPYYDRLVGLFLQTVEGGWPCRIYPADWREKATALIADYTKLRRTNKACNKPERAQGHFAQLRKFLDRAVARPQELTGRDVGRIRLILDRYAAKRGVPGSPRCASLRGRQQRDVSAPMFHQIAQAILPRFEQFPMDGGVDDPASISGPITLEESEVSRIPSGTHVPTSIQRKIERCLNETAQELVKRGVITSGETLARLLPQVTAGLRASSISDPVLRQLYAAIYRAFRRRRSLLLLNLEKQVRIEELPWVAAIEAFRSHSLSSNELARGALVEICALTISSFPHAILPNKLLQEIGALAKAAGMKIPIVDELAADIFMGAFSEKFVASAKLASRVLQGTIYSAYYGIEYEEIDRMPAQEEESSETDVRPQRRRPSEAFAKLCAARAGIPSGGWNVAVNGMIIEQQQILTTQNLAALFLELGLKDILGMQLPEMAKVCFQWVCERQQMKIDQAHARLVRVKNTAYAWRQMIFFLALLSGTEQTNFLEWAASYFEKQSEAFQSRFRPAFEGLILAAKGLSIDNAAGARRFLGWSKSRHWLLDGR